MSDDLLAPLLDRLCGGDALAAEEVFQTCEPFLRLLVRRHLAGGLRAKFDSADVVQSVWAGLLPGFQAGHWHFASPAQLRAFLVKVTRSRLIDRQRHHAAAVQRERPLATVAADALPPSPQPRPSERAQADDLWERLLALCPPAHHELLELRRQGLSLAEAAARTGLHEGSVRRILRRLAREAALRDVPVLE